VTDIHDKMAASHPKLRRGRVWCLSCGVHQDIDTASCLLGGWPKHCGQTMSLDSPAEAEALNAKIWEGAVARSQKDEEA